MFWESHIYFEKLFFLCHFQPLCLFLFLSFTLSLCLSVCLFFFPLSLSLAFFLSLSLSLAFFLSLSLSLSPFNIDFNNSSRQGQRASSDRPSRVFEVRRVHFRRRQPVRVGPDPERCRRGRIRISRGQEAGGKLGSILGN
jgi:hypothetical protein